MATYFIKKSVSLSVCLPIYLSVCLESIYLPIIYVYLEAES